MRDVHLVKLSPADSEYLSELARRNDRTAGVELDALVKEILRHRRMNDAALAMWREAALRMHGGGSGG